MSGYQSHVDHLRRMHAEASKKIGQRVRIKVGGYSDEFGTITDYGIVDGWPRFNVTRDSGMPCGPYFLTQLETINDHHSTDQH